MSLLYDTYGFPIDLTQEILSERGFSVDMDGFHRAMQVQKSTARDARAVTNYMGADATVYDEIDVPLSPATSPSTISLSVVITEIFDSADVHP